MLFQILTRAASQWVDGDREDKARGPAAQWLPARTPDGRPLPIHLAPPLVFL